MRVLVTGAAGFIGSWVIRRLLARGDIVVGIDNLNDYYSVELKRDRVATINALNTNRFEFIQVDFADDKALEAALAGKAFDRIVHLGAQAGVRYSIENPRAYVQCQFGRTSEHLLEVARHRGLDGTWSMHHPRRFTANNDKLPFSVDDRVDHPLCRSTPRPRRPTS